MMRKKRPLFLYIHFFLPTGIILLLALPISVLFSQRIRHIDVNNGLCTNTLTDLTLDHNGNMWIGS
ncbi:MAG: hypothetical protein WBP41_04860, partial [Saprospiraceae bacterium]